MTEDALVSHDGKSVKVVFDPRTGGGAVFVCSDENEAKYASEVIQTTINLAVRRVLRSKAWENDS